MVIGDDSGKTAAANAALELGALIAVVAKAKISICAKVTGSDIEPVVVERRPGDPARVVASADRISSDLGWTAKHNLEDMVASAWAAWQRRH